MNVCPSCEDDPKYERIGKHWFYSPSHRPDLTDYQNDVLLGVLMGDGCLDKPGDNALLKVSMVNRRYLEYLDGVFGVFGRGVRKTKNAEEAANSSIVDDADPSNYNAVYEFITTTHPEFNQYRSWYTDGGKVWKNIHMNDTVLSHLYVCDGTLTEQDQIVISMSSQRGNKDVVESAFESAGLPSPSNWNEYERKEYGGYHCKAQWTQDQTEQLFDLMGDPLPGFEYKWPEDRWV